MKTEFKGTKGKLEVNNEIMTNEHGVKFNGCPHLLYNNWKLCKDGRKNNGGHKTAGRKPVADKKKRLDIYVKTSIIEKNGGVCETKLLIRKWIHENS